MTSKPGMLFDTSPIEDEDGKKKKKAKKKAKSAEPSFAPTGDQAEYEFQPFIMPLVRVAVCDRCKSPVVDLAEIIKIDGLPQWRVVCGWSCGNMWTIDPIPGLLDDADKTARKFVLREGRFAGKTLDDVWASGNEWYVRDLARLASRSVVARAASEWLAKKSID
jgi:hypothetical protein